MDWILVGKSYLIVVIGIVSIHLIKGMLRLRRKYSLSFGMEDWVEWKDWFIFYLPFHTALIRCYSTYWFGVFFGGCAIGLFVDLFLG